MDIEQYVLDNYAAALEKNYIQVYYQPVIRTMSTKLCSFEGLARWVDPELGIIRPDQFIPVLERASKIHLIDRHVVREVCKLLRNTMDVGGIPIPVSINLSRLDFSLCDIFSFVNEEVSYYKIPRDYLYIEITESVMAEQASSMITAVNRFRDAGYQVWMDDFGSAYSSLNVLKDFSFDEIKLDMRFLSSFNQRSRRILASVIQMAKEIDICTLAEGVETEEQYEFLRDIGCEKVQGYYFGKPMPYKDVIVHLKERGIGIERPNERRYYSDIGKVNVLSAVPFMGKEERGLISSARDLNSIPLAIAEGYEDGFSILFYNTAFEKTVRGAGYGASVFSMQRLGEKMPYSLLPASVINLMDSTKVNGDGRMSFISNEEYYEIQAKCIAHNKDVYCVLFRLDNLSQARGDDKRSTLDAGLKQIYSLFERVTLINIREDSITPLYVATRDDVVSGRKGIVALGREYAEKWIINEDRDAYLAFSDISTLGERIKKSNKLHISQYFRVYTRHGRYAWKRYTYLHFHDDMFIEMIRGADEEVEAFTERQKDAAHPDEGVFTMEHLWKTMVSSDILRLFWKDEDRRFVGVSKAFLDYYGFRSPSIVIGKTDEDLGWHTLPDHYMNDELSVIHEGVTTWNMPGYCISNGESREIFASKTPVYDDSGRIKGLVGFFVDKDFLTVHDTRGTDTKRKDMLTGLLNARGIAEEGRLFQDAFYLRNTDFVRIHVDIDDFQVLIQQYGFDFGDKVIGILGKQMKDEFGLDSAIGRLSGEVFVILKQIRSAEEVKAVTRRLKELAGGISEVEGIPVTLYLSVGTALYSETEDLDEQAKRAERRLLTDHNVHSSIENRMSKVSELFHMYDSLPLLVSVYKVVVDDDGRVTDAEVIYVNRCFENELDIKAVDALGKTTRNLFPQLPEDWYDKVQHAAVLGESIRTVYLNEQSGVRYHMTMSQVVHPGFCCVTYQKADITED